jgi:hypothetical protein
VDGPSHFLVDFGRAHARQAPTGATRLKRRLLRALGWEVHLTTHAKFTRD